MRCGAVLVTVISAGEWDAPVDKTDGEAHVGNPSTKLVILYLSGSASRFRPKRYYRVRVGSDLRNLKKRRT